MPRHVIAAVLTVVVISSMMIVPAAAQEESEYEITGVYLISEGSARNIYRVETDEPRLSRSQAQEVCEDVGLEDLIGVKQYGSRQNGWTDVTCAGDELPTLTVDTYLGPDPIDAHVDVFIADEGDVIGPDGVCTGPQFVAHDDTGDDGTVSIVLPENQDYCVEASSNDDSISALLVETLTFQDSVHIVFNFSSPK